MCVDARAHEDANGDTQAYNSETEEEGEGRMECEPTLPYNLGIIACML